MLFFGIKNLWFRLGIFLVLTILMMFFIWKRYENFFVTDPYDPNLVGTARYGHNGESDFQTFAVMALIEFGILLAVLLSYSFNRFYFIRVLILQGLFGVWFFLIAIAGMHAGGVHAIHTIWLLAVNIILFVLLVLSVIAEIVGRKKYKPQLV